MSDKDRRISAEALPEDAAAQVGPEDIQDAPEGGANVRGGVREGFRTGIRDSKVLGIRSIRDIKRSGFRENVNKSSWKI